MADNNFNSQGDWKQRIADLQDTGDTSFDQELAWNRLHERLQDKKPKKRFIWYWLAAASVAAMLILSILMTNKTERMPVHRSPVKLVDNKQQAGTLIKASHNDVEQPASITVVDTTPPAGMKNQDELNQKKKETLTSPSIEVKSDDIVKKEIMDIAAIPVDTAISIVANAPVKKKLRVVHVNELGDPVNEPFQYKKYDDKASSRLRFMNQQVLSLPSVEAQTDHKIFSIKTN